MPLAVRDQAKNGGKMGRMQAIFANNWKPECVHLPLLDMVRKKKTEEMEGTADLGVNETKENRIWRNFRFPNLSHFLTII